ncbi:hypothetical protein, partial [Streptomyces sp. bgisy029]|uniref:hypothetical protein n=1 Tax=Streptomyces sp. bgisy029 TaxID=3413771 RepID=UPI003D74687D
PGRFQPRRLEEMLSSTDRAAGRAQDPQDGTHHDEDSTDRRQQGHADKQADNQQKKSKDDHFSVPIVKSD